MKNQSKSSRKDLAERKQAESQITSLKSTIRYDTTEYTIGYLTKMFDNGKTDIDDGDDYVIEKFVIPNYQRVEDIWNDDKKSLFIESILLGLPIPYIYLYEIEESGDLEIVDGVQRLSTLYSFIQGNLRLRKLEKLTDLQGFYFYDLTDSSQKKFKNTTLRAVKLDAKGVSSEEFRRDIIFARINRGGEKLKDSEFRKGSFPGNLTDFVDELSKNEIEFYYQILFDVMSHEINNRRNDSSRFRAEIKTKDNTRFIRIMKSNFLLMLYNLIESCVKQGFEEIYEALEAENISYVQASYALRDVWSNYEISKSYQDDATVETYGQRIKKISENMALI